MGHNNIVISKNSHRSGLLYFSILFILCKSGMIYFDLMGKVTNYLFWIYGIILLVQVNRKYEKHNLALLSGIMVVRGLITILQMNFSISYFYGLVGFLLTLNTVIQIAQIFSRDEIASSYVNSLFVISLISLFFFAIATFGSHSFIYSISEVNGHYQHSIVYLWGWDGFLFTRNSGPWWEPGAFQCFISLVMLMIASGQCTKVKHIRLKLLVLLVTWMTTQSTTGYLIMAVVLVMMFKQITEIIFGYQYERVSSAKKFLLISLVAAVMVFFYINIGAENITDKLAANNDSNLVRMNDIFSSFKISMISPILGVGESLTKYYSQYGIVNNSAGLLTMVCNLGWPYFLTYILLLLLGINRFYGRQSMTKAVVACGIILTISMTEGIVYLPAFLMFFPYYRDECKKRKK